MLQNDEEGVLLSRLSNDRSNYSFLPLNRTTSDKRAGQQSWNKPTIMPYLFTEPQKSNGVVDPKEATRSCPAASPARDKKYHFTGHHKKTRLCSFKLCMCTVGGIA